VIISRIAEQIEGNVLVLQPNKEILEQNIAKYRALGKEASIYSAILRQKNRSQVTFATIGSLMTNRREFLRFKNVIIDECHVVNPNGGQYEFFLNNIPGLVCVGLTATPYRLRQSGRISVIEFLTRQRPQFFKKVIHVTQQKELREAGFLAPIKYKTRAEININALIVKNGEYEEHSVKREYRRVGIEDIIVQEIEALEKEKRAVLGFCEFIETLEAIRRIRPDIPAITGETPQEERSKILQLFRSGFLKTVINVGVLTTGFDFPELDGIVVAKATRSLSLWYQIIGRGQRIAPGKDHCTVVDVCGNLPVLGDPQKLEVVEINGKWVVKQEHKIITNKALQS
jgi:DNA repair protein RadD